MNTLFPESGEALTEAEQEVMELVCEGLTNKEIGDRRLSSPRTAQAQVSAILTKLAARNRTHAAVIYTRREVLGQS